MAPRCYQSLDNGQRCNSPAIHGSRFCRHHDQQRTSKPAKENAAEMEPLALPPLIDKPSILAAINVVVHALAEGRIKRSVAETLMSAIRLANRLITEIAEAGLSHLLTIDNLEPTPVALAASSNQHHHPNGAGAFNPAHSNPAALDEDPETAQLLRELLAQSHELQQSQKANGQ
ncbi:MAG: hypothetical protein JST28_20115 [Acidobacteria bacterium]|nr:hypothetical protein [Acidobacteriota bacterium]